jgi:hypothetical protein
VCRAHQHGVRLFVDAEESWFQHTIDLAYDMMAKYNREKAIVGIPTSSTATTGWKPQSGSPNGRRSRLLFG